MKNFKACVWIFIIFLIQTVIAGHISIFGAAPSVVLSYIMCVTVLENEFRRAASVSIVCAAIMGALCGRDFLITVLFYTYSSILVFSLRDKPMYLNNCLRSILWTLLASAVLEAIYLLYENMTLTANMLLFGVLPTAVINAVCAAVIYPLLKKTVYTEENQKPLIA